jgi:hypothetical protein
MVLERLLCCERIVGMEDVMEQKETHVCGSIYRTRISQMIQELKTFVTKDVGCQTQKHGL